MSLPEAQRLRELERENTELKKLLADQLLQNKALEIALEKTPRLGATKIDYRQSAGRKIMAARLTPALPPTIHRRARSSARTPV